MISNYNFCLSSSSDIFRALLNYIEWPVDLVFLSLEVNASKCWQKIFNFRWIVPLIFPFLSASVMYIWKYGILCWCFYTVNNTFHSRFDTWTHLAREPFMLIVSVFQLRPLKHSRLVPICHITLIANVAKSWLLNFWAAPLCTALHFSSLE